MCMYTSLASSDATFKLINPFKHCPKSDADIGRTGSKNRAGGVRCGGFVWDCDGGRSGFESEASNGSDKMDVRFDRVVVDSGCEESEDCEEDWFEVDAGGADSDEGSVE